MNTVVIKRGAVHIAENLTVGKPLALGALLFLLVFDDTRMLLLSLLKDAYFQVSVFVAATLLGLLFFERLRPGGLEAVLRRRRNWQPFIGAGLGAVPGCGGAIVVMTQYIRGSMSFGGVVATLAATMGDAAFLLLATAPATALLVFAVCWVTGVVSGYAVDAIHGRNFLRCPVTDGEEEAIEENPLLEPFYKLWMALFVPGAVVAVAVAAQVDVAAEWRVAGVNWVNPFGAAAALLAVAMWAFNPLSDFRMYISHRRPLARRVADTTNFITLWVLFGFIAYGLISEYFNFDLAALFDAWKYYLPLIAILVGFIPGCGPQIVVTTLYINGIIPLSAQMANAISNDGDALFPAVAVAPKAAIIATLYTAVPAFIVGYGWFLLLE